MKQFDRNAEAYHAIRHKIAYPERLYSMLSASTPSHAAALDIGCGNGVSTIRLKPYYDYVEGRDLGANLIEKARLAYPELVFEVCPSEELFSTRAFDLVTSATSFYWMDRDLVLQRVADLLADGGIFCAYKYDFPVVYGPARSVIESDLASHWSRHRDPRLTRYDDTLEKMESSQRFGEAERFVLSNIITLTPLEVALFFLSTSYVTKYMENGGGPGYAEDFVARIRAADPGDIVHVNFDIHGFKARKRK